MDTNDSSGRRARAPRRIVAGALVVAGLVLGGCGDDTSSDATSDATTDATSDLPATTPVDRTTSTNGRSSTTAAGGTTPESGTPAIVVESPAPGQTLTSPFRLSGTANTFEATFMVALIDSEGRTVYEHFVTATSGSGIRGTFDEEISFSGAAGGPGTLRVWESSAKDGSAVNVVEIPVML